MQLLNRPLVKNEVMLSKTEGDKWFPAYSGVSKPALNSFVNTMFLF